MINDYSERHFAFEGCFNFRDIGGYPTKEGKKIKKGSQPHLTELI